MNDSEIIRPSSFFIQPVTEKFYPLEGKEAGIPLHWDKIKFRIYPGETTIWSGYNGHGKSLFLNGILMDMATQGGRPEASLIASFEMKGVKTLYRLVRQICKTSMPTPKQIEWCLKWLGDKIFIYDKTGTGNVNTLIRMFQEAQKKHNVKHFLVDSLMKCGIDPEDYAGQKRFVDTFQNFAQDTGAHVHIIAHARKAKDEEDRPGKMDVRGAGEITDLADNVFSIWRNKKKERLVKQFEELHYIPHGRIEDVKKEYDCVIDCSKTREMGGDVEGQYGFYFHRPSFQFVEHQYQDPFDYRNVK